MAKPVRDLSGMRFGKITIIERSYIKPRKSDSAAWIGQCDCGVVKTFLTCDLVSNKVLSCGCWKRRRLWNYTDLTGTKFNRLYVLGPSEKRHEGFILWRCLCECGNIIYTTVSALKGTTKSCGCLNRDNTINRNKQNTKHGLWKEKSYRKAMERRRREKKKNLDSGWTPLMEMALFAFMSSCVICGTKENLSVDHVKPLYRGFGLYPGNAVVLCRKHNSYKKERDLDALLPIEKEKILEAAESFRLAWSGGF